MAMRAPVKVTVPGYGDFHLRVLSRKEYIQTVKQGMKLEKMNLDCNIGGACIMAAVLCDAEGKPTHTIEQINDMDWPLFDFLDDEYRKLHKLAVPPEQVAQDLKNS